MAISLGMNIAALRAQRALADASARYSVAQERLSSGQRINRASDDAAGLSIADSLRSQRRLLSAATRNINDALSVSAISSSGVQQQISLLARLQELAAQSANGVYENSQRRALSAEYSELVEEYIRIADTTSFNGIRLLQGSRAGSGTLTYQVGTAGSSGSQITTTAVDTSSLSGRTSIGVDYNGDGLVDDTDFVAYASLAQGAAGSLTLAQLLALNKGQFGASTIIDSSGATREVRYALIATIDDFNTAYGGFTTQNMRESGFSIENFTIVAFVKSETSDTYDFAGDLFGPPAVAGTENSIYSVGLTMTGGRTGSLTVDLRALQVEWDQELSGSEAYGTEALTWSDSAIDLSGVETRARALRALDTVRNRISELTAKVGDLGGIESRLMAALNLTTSRNDAVAEAESRIRDADIASEAAQAAKGRVLQQVAQSVLAQANLIPQLALSLLRA